MDTSVFPFDFPFFPSPFLELKRPEFAQSLTEFFPSLNELGAAGGGSLPFPLPQAICSSLLGIQLATRLFLFLARLLCHLCLLSIRIKCDVRKHIVIPNFPQLKVNRTQLNGRVLPVIPSLDLEPFPFPLPGNSI